MKLGADRIKNKEGRGLHAEKGSSLIAKWCCGQTKVTPYPPDNHQAQRHY